MNFPCAICQYTLNGDFLWNIHGSSLDEDRHILCTPCLIKYSHENAKCPLRCHNTFNPVRLNKGYNKLITHTNELFINNNSDDKSIPDDDVLKNIQLWNKLIDNIEDYIELDYYPVVYGTGVFKNITHYMRTLKSNDFEDSIEEIFKINNVQNLDDKLTLKIGLKRKIIEDQIEEETNTQRPRIHFNLSDLFEIHT